MHGSLYQLEFIHVLLSVKSIHLYVAILLYIQHFSITKIWVLGFKDDEPRMMLTYDIFTGERHRAHKGYVRKYTKHYIAMKSSLNIYCEQFSMIRQFYTLSK